MFKFDSSGFLLPYNEIPTTSKYFYDFFINGDLKFKDTRIKRGEELKLFFEFIKKHDAITKPFKVWIFGSLVGNYKEPDDIDIRLFFEEIDFHNVSSSCLAGYIMNYSKQLYNVQCDFVEKIPTIEEDIMEYNHLKSNLPTRIKGGEKEARGFISFLVQVP